MTVTTAAQTAARKRLLNWVLIVSGLMVLSIGITAARDFRPPNPYDYRAGYHEDLYIMRVPRTYGNLIKLPSLYSNGIPPLDGTVSAQSVGARAASGPATIDGQRAASSPSTGGGLAPKFLGEDSAGPGGMLQPTGSSGSVSDSLDSSLRDAIRKLHSK